MSEEEKNLVNKIERLINKEEEYFTNEDLKELLNILDKYVELYKTEQEKNKKIEDKIKEKIEWLEKNIIDNDYASENDKDVAENQIYILEWLI